MENIFNGADNAALLERINKLNGTSTPLWGKMTVGQMVQHCQKPLHVADGTLLLKRSLIGFLFGKMAKKSFIKNAEIKKNLPTAPEFKIVDLSDFEKERRILSDLVTKFGQQGPAVIANKTHPFFGTMNDEEWGVLQYKHLDHHLKQFDV